MPFWQHLSWIKSLRLPVLGPCLLPLSPSKLILRLVNMGLDSFDLYVLPLCPHGLLVNRPVSLLPWRLMWPAAKRYTGVNHGWALSGFSCKQGYMPLNYNEMYFTSGLMHETALFSVCDTLSREATVGASPSQVVYVWMMTIKWHSIWTSCFQSVVKKIQRQDQGLWIHRNS